MVVIYHRNTPLPKVRKGLDCYSVAFGESSWWLCHRQIEVSGRLSVSVIVIFSQATCFNAWGLLYESVFDALFISSSYRPVGKSVSHHVITRPTFSSLSFLDHHTSHPTRHDAQILLYECALDAL
jgi:hypothetical protein